MTETVFEKFATAAATLKLDFSSEEFALYAEEHELSETEMAAVERVFTYLSEKKQQTTVHTLLRLSRLPTKAPRTFENFDFSLLKGRDVERLKALPSLSAIHSHRNLAFIGPAGTGKTHLAAFGYACCQHGMKTYDKVRAELKKAIERTQLVDVYTFESRGASTLPAGDHYILALEDSDICIFLIDNQLPLLGKMYTVTYSN